MHPSSHHTLILTLIITLLIIGVPPSLYGSGNSWEELQRKGAKINFIEIKVDNVFDLTKPEEDTFIARIANFIHITTRKKVISKTILFAPDDSVDPGIIHESERLLRSLPYIRDAEIIPLVSETGRVTALVRVHDAWSLNGGVKFHHVGGESSGGVKLEERNFLGYGKQVSFDHEKDPIRTTNAFGYRDPQLFWSRWTMSMNYQEFSDGSGKNFILEHPFYSLETPWALGTSFSHSRTSETLFNEGRTALGFPVATEDWLLYASYLYRFRHRRAWRIGIEVGSSSAHYGDLTISEPGLLPNPDLRGRRFRGIVARWELIEDRFETFENIRAIARTEDYNIGWESSAKVGYFFKSWGSSSDAAFTSIAFSKGFVSGRKGLFLLGGNFRGRREGREFVDMIGTTHLTYYDQRFPYQTIASNISVTAGSHLDPEDIIYLGGSQGLRGYPDYFKGGNRRWISSVEDRIITRLDLLGLVRLGFVIFADGGSAYNFRTGKMSKIFVDIGGGLRLGNLKSAFGRVILLSVAFPLVKEEGIDSYQLVVGNVVHF